MEHPSTSPSVLGNPALAVAIRSMVMKAYGETMNAQEIEDKVNGFLLELASGYEQEGPRTSEVVVRSREARTGKEKTFNILMELLAGCAGAEVANLIAGVASLVGRKYLGPRTVLHKRQREQADEEEDTEASRKKARTENDDPGTVNVAGEGPIRDVSKLGAPSVVEVQGHSADPKPEEQAGKGLVLSAASSTGSKSHEAPVTSPALIAGDKVLASSTTSSSRAKSVNGQVIWADYVCDDSDSSYAPSTGTSDDDDAHMTEQDLQELSEYRKRCLEYQDLDYISGDLSSDHETDANDTEQTDILWKDYPSEDESDPDDADYVPPNWTFEDVLEIVTDPARGWEMDRLYYMNEIIDRGPVSDAGISDSDSDAHNSNYREHGRLRDISTLSRYVSDYTVPEHLTTYNTLPSYFYIDRFKKDQPMLDARKKNTDWYQRHILLLSQKAAKKKKTEPDLEQYDINARIDTLLDDDHLQYAFDDWEWKGFEDPRRFPRAEE